MLAFEIILIIQVSFLIFFFLKAHFYTKHIAKIIIYQIILIQNRMPIIDAGIGEAPFKETSADLRLWRNANLAILY